MSGDVFGNGMLLSRTHPAGRRLRPPAHLPRSGRPIRERASRSASGCSSCRARRWADYDAKLISRAAASSRAARSRSRSRREVAAAARHRRQSAHARRADAARSCKAPVDLLYIGGIGTYVKATERDPCRRRRPRQRRDPRQRRELRVQGRRRRRQPRLHAARAHRVRAAAAAASTPTRSTTRPASTASDHEVNIKILLDAVVARGRAHASSSATSCSRR